jgi:citrate synthase
VIRSEICYLDGEKGILRYRGYPVEQIAAKSSYLETAYLLIYGELPSRERFEYFESEVMHHVSVHVSFVALSL